MEPAENDSAERYFSTVEAAKLLGVGVRTVQLLVDSGKLRAWKTAGGHRRIAAQSIQALLDSRGMGQQINAEGAPAGNAAAAGGAARARVLIIEDSSHFRNLYRLLIERLELPLDVHVASDGIQGLIAIGEIRPDLAIVDLNLPGVDGFALIMGLRTNPNYAHTAVLVVTGMPPEELAERQALLGDTPVVRKSEALTELPRVLRDWVASRG